MFDLEPGDVLDFHLSMLSDKVRTERFRQAIEARVKPGDVVLDIGCGTGLLSFFACEAGARRVYAVEQGPVIELARALGAANGYQDRIRYWHDWSMTLELPERVDVIVSETIGNIGFEEGILGWLQDARKWLLADGGCVIPERLALVAAPAESAQEHEAVSFWSQKAYGLDYGPAKQMAANIVRTTDLGAGALLAEPGVIYEAHLADIEETGFTGDMLFQVQREGIMHGIGAWFEAELAPGIALSNRPPRETPSWQHVLMPLTEALVVSAGDYIDVSVRMQENPAQWSWRAGLRPGGRSSDEICEGWHSTLAGEFAVPESLSDVQRRPTLTVHGRVDAFVLGQMDGNTTVGDIARQVVGEFPLQFDAYERALAHVRYLAEIHSRWYEAE